MRRSVAPRTLAVGRAQAGPRMDRARAIPKDIGSAARAHLHIGTVVGWRTGNDASRSAQHDQLVRPEQSPSSYLPGGGTIFMTNVVGLSFGPNGPGTLFFTGGKVLR